MIRFLFFIEGVNIGGQQTFSYNLLKGLNPKEIQLYTVFVFDGDMKKKYESISLHVQQIGRPYDPFNAFKSKSDFFKTVVELTKFIRKNKIDVICSNGFYSYFSSAITAFITGIKHVRFIGGDLTKNESFHFNKKFHLLPLHWLTHKYFGYNYILNLMAEKGVNKNKLNNLFYRGAVDSNLFKPSLTKKEKNSLKLKHNIPNDHIVIGWIGRIEKNLEVKNTIELLLELKKKGFKKYTLILIGDGNWLNELLQIIKINGLQNHIVQIGFLPQKDLPPYYEILDVLPLLDMDPHGGSKLREAMSCGTVGLSVDGKSREQRNIIENNKTGILVPANNFVSHAANSCIELYNDPIKLKVIAEAGRKFAVERLDFSILTRKLENEIKFLF